MLSKSSRSPSVRVAGRAYEEGLEVGAGLAELIVSDVKVEADGTTYDVLGYPGLDGAGHLFLMADLGVGDGSAGRLGERGRNVVEAVGPR